MSLGGAGTQTAGLAFGGLDTANTAATEEYDGSTWTTSPGSLATARRYLRGCGTQTAGLAAGGTSPPLTVINQTELYDGTSWTTSPASMNTTRYQVGLDGTQTLALAFGGSSYTPGPGAGGGTPQLAETELWDGTSWTSTTSLNTARRGLAGCGTQAAALAFGGGGTAVGTTEEWAGPGVAVTKTITTS
jgi:hypothetical protein